MLVSKAKAENKRRETLQAARRLHQLAEDRTLHPEHRLVLRCLLAGDPDAIEALRRRDGTLVVELLRALRRPGHEKRAVLRLVS